MLIITRSTEEALMIGDEVTVTVLSVNGSQVRLGVDAPRDIEVLREEKQCRAYKNEPQE